VLLFEVSDVDIFCDRQFSKILLDGSSNTLPLMQQNVRNIAM